MRLLLLFDCNNICKTWSFKCNSGGVGNTSKIQFANPTAARKASNLLGVTLEDLAAATFTAPTNGSSSPVRSPSGNLESAWECLEALIIGIYSDVFAAVVNLINKAITTSTANTMASIILLDTPGFQVRRRRRTQLK